MVHILLPYTPFEPVGGVRTVFDYVIRLNELAEHQVADVISDSPYVKSWLPSEYQKVTVLPKSHTLSAEDTLIIPEVIMEEASNYPHIKRKLIVVLNWKYFEDDVNATRLKKLGYSGILTNSTYSARRLEKFADGLSLWNIPHLIDTNVFSPTTAMAKRPRNSILVLSRKNSSHISAMIEFLKGFSHTLTILNNIDPAKMPEYYANHQIFVNLGYPEGFCRPAAEAMASGCVVVGFTGGGGSDFMHSGVTALTAEDGDEEQLLEKLNTALHMSNTKKLDMAKAARAIIKRRYTKELQARVLGKVFETEIGKRISSAHIAKLYTTSKKRSASTRSAKQSLSDRSKTLEILEYQFFQERKQYQELMRSKVYKLWQLYCNLRLRLTRSLNLT